MPRGSGVGAGPSEDIRNLPGYVSQQEPSGTEAKVKKQTPKAKLKLDDLYRPGSRESERSTRSASQVQLSPLGDIKPDVKSLQIMGMTITGVDVNALKSGQLTANIPMSAGMHHLSMQDKGIVEPDLWVDADTYLEVAADFGKNVEGKSVITEIRGDFNQPLKIKNPGSGFQHSEAWLIGGIIDGVKDFAADIEITGFRVNTEGKVSLVGRVNKGWFGEDDINEHIKPGHFPDVNMNLSEKLPENLVAMTQAERDAKAAAGEEEESPVKEPAEETEDPDDMLRRLGGMTELGKFSLHVETEDSAVEVDGEQVHVLTKEGPVVVNVNGTMDVWGTGSVDVQIEDREREMAALDAMISDKERDEARTYVQTPAAKLNIIAGAHITRPSRGRDLTVGVGVKGSLGDVEAELKQEGIVLPVSVGGADDVFNLKAKIEKNESGLKVTDAHVETDMTVEVAEGDRPASYEENLKVGAEKGRLKTMLDARLSYNAAGEGKVRVSQGSATVGVTADKPMIDYEGFKLQARGEFGAKVAMKDIVYATGDKLPGATGTATMTFNPAIDVFGVDIKTFERSVDFVVSDSGKMQISFENDSDLSDLLEDLVNLQGNPEAIRTVADGLPAAVIEGGIKSQAFKEHIQKTLVNPRKKFEDGDLSRTEVPITKNNKVQVLKDGVMSRPKRLEMINNAKNNICMQTLIWKADKTGMEQAEALVAAAKRGVKCRVIIDSLGNMEKLEDLVHEHPVYKLLNATKNIELRLYNSAAETGLREIFEVLEENPELLKLQELAGMKDAELKDPLKLFKLFGKLAEVCQDKKSAFETKITTVGKEKLQRALGHLLLAKGASEAEKAADFLKSVTEDGVLDLKELMQTIKRVADLNHRWHEKYLIVDGQKVVMGGLNIADEYLLGGEVDPDTGKPLTATCLGQERIAWRDTDVFVEGPGACAAFESFADNWESIAGERLENIVTPEEVSVSAADGGGKEVQMIQHRPHVDGDHNIANFFVESLKALKPGEKFYCCNAYFIPTGSLKAYKEALIDAAHRGVDVRVLTNSRETTDMPQLNDAAVFCYRDLLKPDPETGRAVRIFEWKGGKDGDEMRQAIHQKNFAIGGCVSGEMSWNGDNRSGALNSEHCCVVYDEEVGAQNEDMLLDDMSPENATEITYDMVEALPWKQELEASSLAVAADLM